MLDAEEIAKCHFVPLRALKKAVDIVENQFVEPHGRCKRSLLRLQKDAIYSFGDIRQNKWRARFELAVSRAIYSHDWDKLLFLLKNSPPYEHNTTHKSMMSFYLRALSILLMYHPSARAQGLLNDYLHMVLACRSDGDKKALLKLMLALPDKLYRKQVPNSLYGEAR